eukprot:2747055-Heterocapsa_arctica.AAC.1
MHLKGPRASSVERPLAVCVASRVSSSPSPVVVPALFTQAEKPCGLEFISCRETAGTSAASGTA